jgi:hypothetical protein
MRLLQRFREAREVLGVQADAGPEAVKRAYRRAVAAHPPDRDAAEFRRIRAAYELLQDPIAAARDLLNRPVPDIDPPDLPNLPEPPLPHALAVELFRLVVARLPAEVFLSRPAPRSRSRSKVEEAS